MAPRTNPLQLFYPIYCLSKVVWVHPNITRRTSKWEFSIRATIYALIIFISAILAFKAHETADTIHLMPATLLSYNFDVVLIYGNLFALPFVLWSIIKNRNKFLVLFVRLSQFDRVMEKHFKLDGHTSSKLVTSVLTAGFVFMMVTWIAKVVALWLAFRNFQWHAGYSTLLVYIRIAMLVQYCYVLSQIYYRLQLLNDYVQKTLDASEVISFKPAVISEKLLACYDFETKEYQISANIRSQQLMKTKKVFELFGILREHLSQIGADLNDMFGMYFLATFPLAAMEYLQELFCCYLMTKHLTDFGKSNFELVVLQHVLNSSLNTIYNHFGPLYSIQKVEIEVGKLGVFTFFF